MTTRLGIQYQKSKPQPSPTMNPTLEAILAQLTQMNQANTQTQAQLAQLTTQMNQANVQSLN